MFMCHNIYSKLYNSFRWCRMLHYINSFLKPDSLYILSFSDCTQWYSVSLDMILITVRLNLKESWNLQLSLNCITSSSGDELWKNLPDLNRYVVYSWWWIILMSFPLDSLLVCIFGNTCYAQIDVCVWISSAVFEIGAIWCVCDIRSSFF